MKIIVSVSQSEKANGVTSAVPFLSSVFLLLPFLSHHGLRNYRKKAWMWGGINMFTTSVISVKFIILKNQCNSTQKYQITSKMVLLRGKLLLLSLLSSDWKLWAKFNIKTWVLRVYKALEIKSFCCLQLNHLSSSFT